MRYIQYTTIVSTGYNLYPYLNININNANASTVPEAAVSQIYPVFIIECQTMVVAKARKQGCKPRLHDKYFGHGTLKFRHADL